MNKRGLSAVVTTVLLIALSVFIVAIVWVVVKNLVVGELDSVGSCMGVVDKVNLDGRYTCYNSTSGELQFSITVGDIDLDEVLISISSIEKTTSFRLSNELSQIENVYTYPARISNVVLPSKDGGLTYIFNSEAAGFSSIPDSIQIAPIINGKSCGVSDSIEPIDNCYSLIS